MKLKDIASQLDAQLEGDPEMEITGVASLEDAGPSDLCLYLGGFYKRFLSTTKAKALVVSPTMNLSGFALVRVVQPRLRYVLAIRLFHPAVNRKGIHSAAIIDPGAVIGRDVYIGAGAVIGARTTVGDRTEIHAGCVVYEDVTIGDDCRIMARVVIREKTVIGHRVVIQPGAVLGSDGFGYEPDEKGVFHFIPQVGTVVIEDDVELGANTCVDRAALGVTRIGKGTKIDNLCQIAHGDKIGRHTVISGMAGFSGSVTIGDHVMIGGGVGIVDHSVIGDGAIVAGGSGIHGEVPPKAVVAGAPQTDIRTWRRAMAILYRNARKEGPSGREPE